jgi:hypothetical protein
MTIPVSSVVNVSIAIGAPFPARVGFGTLNIVTAETGVIGIAERIRSYQNLDGVTSDWSADSEVVGAATAYFSQQPKPTALKVSTRYPDPQAAQLRGGSVLAGDLASIIAISDGSFAITIDGGNEDITGLNFTTDTDGNQIADTIQTALQAVASGGYSAATCIYEGDETSGRFFINSGTTGATSTISFLQAVDPANGTDVSSLLQMRQGEGTKTDGIDGETITASLTAIQEIDSDWYGLMFTKEVRDDFVVNTESAVEAAADWCEARVKVFANTTNDLDVLDSVTTDDIASVLSAKNLRRTITTFSSYPDQYPSASVLGRAFTVKFSQANSTITLKFKQMPTITVEQLTQSQKATLDSKFANALIEVGSSNMYAESWMASGVFFDEIHGIDWLQNAVETNVFGYLLSRTTKVPYTNKGVAAIEQQVISALDEAVNNGLIAAGETIDGEFLPNGYKTTVIAVEDIDQSDKDARHYPGLSFTVLGAGAIHSVQINGIFER